ncbi:hypothetical protein [Actinoplanes sp. NPDC051411]|uniref:hypothetical protein n=1 Tax=Actinoplanes sp. NPDC051411 TaxID=3155522 RepID=UPI00342EE45F
MNVNARTVRWLLTSWAASWFAAMAWHGGMSWHFFVQGAQALADADDPAGGLHLYAVAPVLQIGPVAFLVTEALRVFGGRPDLLAAQLLGTAGGAYVLWQAGRLGRRLSPWPVLFFVPVWMYLAVASTHLDDVLALVGGVAALAAARAGRPILAGLLLGLAADAKPWALGFAALLLLLPGWRAMLRASASTAAVIALGWLPFFLADPRTSRALHFTIANTPLSALRALGFTDPRTPPWDRPVQALLGIALGIIAVRRGRWPAVLLLAVAARIALDPGTNRYYAAGAVVGALVWDLAGSRLRFPWWTAAAALSLFASRSIPLPAAIHGWITLTYCLATVFLLVPRQPTDYGRTKPAGPGYRRMPVWPREYRPGCGQTQRP